MDFDECFAGLTEYLARKIEAEALGLKELEPKFDPFKNLQVTDSEISKDMLKIVKVERVKFKKRIK